MCDVFIKYFRSTLPDELAASLNDILQYLENGDLLAILQHPQAQLLLGYQEDDATAQVSYKDFPLWSDYIFRRLGLILSKRNEDAGTAISETAAYRQHFHFVVAIASIYAFLQSNITGPPLPFSSSEVLLPKEVSSNSTAVTSLRQQLVTSLSTDGVAAYKLTPNVELLCLAETILICPPIQKNIEAATWARLRINFLRQRLLSEIAPSLQSSIYQDLDSFSASVLTSSPKSSLEDLQVSFLLERAAIHTHHGLDKKARTDLDQAARTRNFDFAITGLMGKRTKFQQKDTSQLVVLARSADSQVEEERKEETASDAAKPTNFDLNDDTLLESISFTDGASTDIKEGSTLPSTLTSLDPANQPRLDSLDSIILLSLASSITNTSPADGLTREETLPYATRVLEGGSSNWQVYTQALLVRSRIEGYKSRTIERGLLQLQALVDQVIAETTASDSTVSGETNGASTTFLPRSKESESAPVSERLRYIFALASPARWDLEAELASRWVSLGGLRSALEIYERLEMWAEAALCWAATEREDKAKKIIRRQLFHPTSGDASTADLEEEKWEGAPRDPPPADAARLYCILGDIDHDISQYEKAWEVSNHRYARAQRSLARHYFTQKDFAKAAEAYNLALKVNALNQTTWFALGCAYLELNQFKDAAGAFSRCVQLDDQDAEAWSNLAAALMHLRPVQSSDPDRGPSSDPRNDALKAFKRAATLKNDNHRIWFNVLTVAASTIPPAYTDIITAQRRLCELRGATDGEKCVDEDILDALVRHVIISDTDHTGYDPAKPGIPRLVVELVDKHIIPLITSSRRLWQIVARLALWRNKPSSALEAHEKAWRAVTGQPGWESSTEGRWNAVVEATVELAEAYESFGPMERTEGLAAGEGEVVDKRWRFKARTAVSGVMSKGRDSWEGTEGWERLESTLEGLKGAR